MISIQGLHKHYKQNQVLKNINLDIREPGIYSILGPNGSGKTTLLKSILGLVIPEKGEILIDKQNISSSSLYRKNIAYLPQIARFPDNLRVKELIHLVKDIRMQDGNEEALIELFNLQHELNKKLGSLSGGTRQKVNMVLGFLFDTPILILDEPTVSLDPLALAKFKKLIAEKRKEGKIILYTTHIMGLVKEFSDQIILLLDGRIIFNGSNKELIKESGKQKLENAITDLVEKNGHE